MIGITYHHDLNEVQADPALVALLDDNTQPAPFDRLTWWQGLAIHCGIAPLLAVARDGDATALLPLVADAHAALANYYNFWVRPVCSDNSDGLLTALAQDLCKRTSAITFAPIPNECGDAARLAKAFRDAGWWVAQEQCDVNHVLNVAGRSFAEYLVSRPGALRTTLQRKAKKVTVHIFTSFDAAAWADYESVYQQSWKPEEGYPAFLADFADTEGSAGRLRLGLAYVDNTAVAAQLWTVDHGTAYIHKLAHTEASKPLSPGTTLTAALLQHVIDGDQVTTVDFGTGNDGYKQDWMEHVRPRYRLICLQPKNPSNWLKMSKITLVRLAARFQRG